MNQLDLHSAEETIAQRAALARLIDGLVRDDGMHPTAIDDLFLIRCSAPSELVHGLHKPALCIIVQGSKEVRLGDELYTYDALHYLVVSVTVPVAGRAGGLVRRAIPLYPPGYRPGDGRHPGG